MSYLSEELKRQMQAQKLTGLQLAERSKISASQIYKWSNNDQTSISADQLDALASALSKDAVNQAKLLVAHLQDERFGARKDMVRIELDDGGILSDKPRARTKGEKALQFLAEQRVEFKGMDELIIDLAKVLGAEL